MSDITFSDVLIEPQYSEIPSRSVVDVSSDMGKFKLTLPIISSNMRDITGEKMCIEMATLGGLGILHRYMSIEDNVEMVKRIQTKASSPYSFGVSIGVKEEEKKRFYDLYNIGVRLFCIDQAHGHCLMMKDMLKWVRNSVGKEVYIIAGNIATYQAVVDLTKWGADCCKCGIGPGAPCTTRKNSGVGVPQLTALHEIRKAIVLERLNVKLIADGGIQYPGDVSKALKFADAVMVGSVLSGTTETPGHVYQNPEGQFYKTYAGSASGENKVKGGGENKFVEGIVKTVPFRGHVKYIIHKIEDGLRSALSYSGAWNLKEFQEKAILREISFGSKIESKI